jgi:rod shape-determining protein MreC
LALFLMVADARFKVVEPVRQVVSTVLYPVQWAMVQPIRFFSGGVTYFDDLETAQQEAQEARQAMLAMAQRATQPTAAAGKRAAAPAAGIARPRDRAGQAAR